MTWDTGHSIIVSRPTMNRLEWLTMVISHPRPLQEVPGFFQMCGCPHVENNGRGGSFQHRIFFDSIFTVTIQPHCVHEVYAHKLYNVCIVWSAQCDVCCKVNTWVLKGKENMHMQQTNTPHFVSGTKWVNAEELSNVWECSMGEMIFKKCTSHNEQHGPNVYFLKITSPMYDREMTLLLQVFRVNTM